MNMFGIRRPRGFHHEYIYYDEREEKLSKIEQRAKEELGISQPSARDYERLRGKFASSTHYLSRRKANEKAGRRPLSAVTVLIAIAVLAAVWLILSE